MRVAILAAVISLCACLSASARYAAMETGPLPALDRNAAILDAVLGDLTTYRGGDLPLSLAPSVPRTIYATPWAPPIADPPGIDLLLRAVVNTVPRTLKDKVRQAENDAELHRATRHAVQSYRPMSDRVVFDTHIDGADYRRNDPVSIWAPGYSRDGSVAVVSLYFPETLHPSVALYALESTPRGWIVRARSFLTYL
jgi:hypothetical protein